MLYTIEFKSREVDMDGRKMGKHINILIINDLTQVHLSGQVSGFFQLF